MKRLICIPMLLAVCACEPAPNNLPDLVALPAAMQGCWTLDGQTKDSKIREQINISGSKITFVANWESAGMEPHPVSILHPTVVTPKLLEGNFMWWQSSDNLKVYATKIGLGIDGALTDQLVVVGGDAGSRRFSRCEHRMQT